MHPEIKSESYKKLYEIISDLYHSEENKSRLLFHGWHHIKFVHDKAIEFAKELNANLATVASASLVHDLNYIFSEKLEPEVANEHIKEYLMKSGFIENDILNILEIVETAHLKYRGKRNLSNEAKALADADTLFKALPTTPILFASNFIVQNKYDVSKLAHKIIDEQEPLILKDEYFYTQLAKTRYLKWAKVNLEMWKSVLEALEDQSISEMLRTAKDLGVL